MPTNAQVSASDVVDRFIDCFSRMDLEAALELAADDIHYDNVPIPTKNDGKDAVRQALGPFLAGATSVEFKVLRQASTGNLVMNERVDRFERDGGWVEIPVMGLFEVNDAGLITLWRDYFDMASLRP